MDYLVLSRLNATGYDDLGSFVVFFLNFAISMSVVVAVVSLLTAGFKFILSGGDEKKVSEASRSLIFSIIGLILVFVSPNLIKFVVEQFLKS